jgi:PEGA domain
MKTAISFFSIIVVLGLISGCATIFAAKSQSLSVTSDPTETEVYANGLKMGVTPVELDLKADKSYIIEFRKEGFQTITKVVNTKVGPGWIVLDLLMGGIPVIVDASTGAWRQFDQNSVNAILEAQNK